MSTPSTRRRDLRLPAIVLAAGMLLLLAAGPASARPRVAVEGTTVVGAKLTAKITGGRAAGITWQACAVKPSGRSCPAASLTRLGTRRTYTLTAGSAGAYVRVQARIRANGQTRTVASVWSGPVSTPDDGGGGSGGGAKVGLYQCPLFPYGTTFISILAGGKYLGPYSDGTTTPGTYRLVGGTTKYPGGQVFEYLDGPYAAPTWRNEYYPTGFTAGGTVYTEAQILIVLPERDDRQVCSWIRADPPYFTP